MGTSASALRRAVDSADSPAVIQAAKSAPTSREEPLVTAGLLKDAVKQQLSDAAFAALLNRAVADSAPTKRAPLHLETVRDAIDFVAAFRLKHSPAAAGAERTSTVQQPQDDLRFLRAVVRTPGALAFAPPALTAALPSIAGCLDPPSALRLITAHPQIVCGSGAYPTLLHYGVDPLYNVASDVLDLACRCAVALHASAVDRASGAAAADNSPRARVSPVAVAAVAAASETVSGAATDAATAEAVSTHASSAAASPASPTSSASLSSGAGSGVDGASSGSAAALLRRVTGSGGGPAGRIGVFLADRRPETLAGCRSVLDEIIANGMTPLMWACLRVNPAAAAVLLRHGADPTAAPAVAAPTPSARGETAAALAPGVGAAAGAPVAKTVQLLMAPSAAPLLARLQVLRLLLAAAGQSLVVRSARAATGNGSPSAAAAARHTTAAGAADAEDDTDDDADDHDAAHGLVDGADPVAAGPGSVPEPTELRVPDGFFDAQDRGVPVHAMNPQQYRRYMEKALAAATRAAAAADAEAAAATQLAGDERAAAALSLDSAASAGLSGESLSLLAEHSHLSPLRHHAAWRRFSSHCLVAMRGAPEARLQAYWHQMTDLPGEVLPATAAGALADAGPARAAAAAAGATGAVADASGSLVRAESASAEPSVEEMRHAVDRGFRAVVLAGLRDAAWRRRRAVLISRARNDDE